MAKFNERHLVEHEEHQAEAPIPQDAFEECGCVTHDPDYPCHCE